METFPKDIVLDILSRLPVKALGQSRCVSKTWYKLISNPHLVKLQLNRSITHETHTQKLIINVSSFSIQSGTCSSFLSSVDVESNPDHSLLGFDFLPLNSSDRVELMSSCNGLVSMLVNFKTFFLLNPLTREFKKLPDHVFKWQYYGFGYDSFSDDYKVVLGSCEGIGNGYLVSIVIKVYSLRSNCWKQIQQVMPHYIRCPNGVFANGAIHWEALRNSQKLSCHIVSFNLAEEKFKVVPQPNDGAEGCLFILGVLGGNLVMSRYGCGTVWIMEEYGVRESWTALLHFAPAEKPDSKYLLSPVL